jgi:uncharacterized membrane protein (UPF0127 family)
MKIESKIVFPQKKKILIVVLGLICCLILIVFIVHLSKVSIPAFVPVQQLSNENILVSGSVISPQGVRILVQIADDDSERELGLSFRESLPEHTGMLFVFPQMGTYEFWMKDMKFPIDIVWIDEAFRIIDRTINVLPESYPKTFTSKVPAKYVLEIPANTADSSGFVIGSVITIDQN